MTGLGVYRISIYMAGREIQGHLTSFSCLASDENDFYARLMKQHPRALMLDTTLTFEPEEPGHLVARMFVQSRTPDEVAAAALRRATQRMGSSDPDELARAETALNSLGPEGFRALCFGEPEELDALLEDLREAGYDSQALLTLRDLLSMFTHPMGAEA